MRRINSSRVEANMREFARHNNPDTPRWKQAADPMTPSEIVKKRKKTLEQRFYEIEKLDQGEIKRIQDERLQTSQIEQDRKQKIIKEVKTFFENSMVEIDEKQLEDSYSVFSGESTMDKLEPGSSRSDYLNNEEKKVQDNLIEFPSWENQAKEAASEYLLSRVKIGNRFINNAQFKAIIASYREGLSIDKIADKNSLPRKPLSLVLKAIDSIGKGNENMAIRIGDKIISQEEFQIIKNKKQMGFSTMRIAREHSLTHFSLEHVLKREDIRSDDQHAIKIGQQFISEAIFKRIIKKRASGETVPDIAFEFGLSKKSLYHFLENRINSTKKHLSNSGIKIGVKTVDVAIFDQIKRKLVDGGSLTNVASEYGLVRQKLSKALEADESENKIIKIGYRYIQATDIEKIKKRYDAKDSISAIANEFNLDSESLSLYLKRNESESKSSKDLLTLKVERDLSIISSNRTNIVKKINENYDVPSIARELDVNMDILLIAIKLDKKSPVQEIKSKEFIRIGQTAYSMDQIDDIVQKRLTGKTILELARLYRNEYDALDLFLKGIQIKPIVINERDIIDFLDHFHPGSKMISYKSNSDINSAEIIIRCDKNHVFPTETNTLLNLRAWCNECYRNDVCITVEDIKAFLARNRPGSILISTDIEKNADSKVKIRCPKGHVYEKVIKKLWTSQCTECNLSFQERACKTVFDGIFSKISSSHKYFN
nr:hypothetical protein [Candidatus Sigynarchaeum springense]